MATTQNIHDWLDSNVDSEEWGQILSLYEAVSEGSEINDFWEITRKGEQMFIRCGDDWLKLATQSAIETFLSIIDEKYGHGLGVESWCACQRAIDNDKT